MRVTIEIIIKSARGTESFVDEVEKAMPDHAKLVELTKRTIGAVLPIKFRLHEKQTLSAFIEFADS